MYYVVDNNKFEDWYKVRDFISVKYGVDILPTPLETELKTVHKATEDIQWRREWFCHKNGSLAFVESHEYDYTETREGYIKMFVVAHIPLHSFDA